MRLAELQGLADCTDVRAFHRVHQCNDRQIDPGRLIESTFLGAVPEDELEAVLIAWLSVLPKSVDAGVAATALVRHLSQLPLRSASASQLRFLDLLLHVASHRRAPSRAFSRNVQQKAES
jgi:hypothetical protein